MVVPHVGDCLCAACENARQPVSDYEMACAMKMYGGSFVSRLGELWFAADGVNKAKLVAAFPEYVADYRDVARLKREKATP